MWKICEHNKWKGRYLVGKVRERERELCCLWGYCIVQLSTYKKEKLTFDYKFFYRNSILLYLICCIFIHLFHFYYCAIEYIFNIRLLKLVYMHTQIQTDIVTHISLHFYLLE